MLAIWIALGAVVTLVLLLVIVLVVQTARGRRRPDGPDPEILSLDPGPADVAGRAVLIADRLAALDRDLGTVRARLDAVRDPGATSRYPADPAAADRQLSVDRAFAAGAVTDEVREAPVGLDEHLTADLSRALSQLRTARGDWAGLDRQPLDRRAGQARGVLAEADLLVGRLQDAQIAWLRYAVLRIRRAVATGDPAATAIAEQALADVRGMEPLADLRREVDELLENLDLTTRADRVLHPRLARDREGTSAVRTLVADRPWLSAADLLPATSDAWKV